MKTKTENPVHIQYVDIERIIPYEKNAKIHDQKQIDNVAESLRRFGWKQPLVIDGNDVLVIGHCRLLAAKKLGEKKVPVIIADERSEEDIKTLYVLPEYYGYYAKQLKDCDSEARLREMPEDMLKGVPLTLEDAGSLIDEFMNALDDMRW